MQRQIRNVSTTESHETGWLPPTSNDGSGRQHPHKLPPAGETPHMTLCFRRRNRALKFQSRK